MLFFSFNYYFYPSQPIKRCVGKIWETTNQLSLASFLVNTHRLDLLLHTSCLRKTRLDSHFKDGCVQERSQSLMFNRETSANQVIYCLMNEEIGWCYISWWWPSLLSRMTFTCAEGWPFLVLRMLTFGWVEDESSWVSWFKFLRTTECLSLCHAIHITCWRWCYLCRALPCRLASAHGYLYIQAGFRSWLPLHTGWLQPMVTPRCRPASGHGYLYIHDSFKSWSSLHAGWSMVTPTCRLNSTQGHLHRDWHYL